MFRSPPRSAPRGDVRADVYVAIAEIAGRQHGAVSVAQARAAGLTAKAQRTAIARGPLVHVHPNVIVVAGAPASWLQRLHAGTLALDGRG